MIGMVGADNFVIGDFFADVKCRLGHQTRLFNIGRGHYIACDECHSYVFVDANLMSCWRRENQGIWQQNHDSVKGYRFIR